MRWPTLIIDNFFNNFESVVKLSNKLEYYPTDGHWPGLRSGYLSNVNRPFFEMTAYKILQALYPMNYQNLTWTARMQFQKIKQEGLGIIHQDDDEFTAIVYISGNKNQGTSLYKPKAFPYDRDSYVEKKFETYKDIKKINKEFHKLVHKHNSQFELTTRVNFEPNKLFLFDANHQHAADSFDNQERCILITFFEEIRMRDGRNFKTAGRECKKWG